MTDDRTAGTEDATPVSPPQLRRGETARPVEWWPAVLLALGIVAALLVRLGFFGFEGNDYRYFMGPWYDFIASHGGFLAFKHNFSDYAPPYLYLLAVATVLPLAKLHAIKLVSVVFDLVLAAGVALIVRERHRGRFVPSCAFLVTLLAPTVLVNSALWGQNDSIFTSFLVLSVLFLIRGRGRSAMLTFGVALAFKAQAVFLSPLLLVLVLKKQIRLRDLFLVPAVYLALMMPAVIAGRPLVDLLLVFFRQAGEYRHLTMGAPNLYQWLPDNYALFRDPGLLFTAALVLVLCAVAVKGRSALGPDGIMRLAMVSVLVVPFCLPGMHERYFFPADVLSIAFAFFFPRFFAVPVVVGLVSTFAYMPFLLGNTVLPQTFLAIILLAAIAAVVADWVRSLTPGPAAGRAQGFSPE
jgi:Gpi18-like mannosyltransferase